MFEQYRKEVDSLRLSDKTTDRILQTLNTPQKAPHPLPIRRIAALVACVALIVAAALTNTEKPVISFYPDTQDSPDISVTLPAEHLTYAEVFALLEDMGSTRGDTEWITEDDFGTPEATPTVGTHSAAINKGDTTTNTQYEDVDEADYVKAQNGYVYVLNSIKGELTVYRADGAQSAAVATRIPADRKNVTLRDMYLTADRLVVLYTLHNVVTADKEETDVTADDAGGAPLKPTVTGKTGEHYSTRYRYTENHVYTVIYDITDPADPRPLTEYGQDGDLVDSRMVDGVLYLITNPRIYEAKADDPATFVPSLYRDDVKTAVAESALLAIEEPNSATYALVTAVAVTDETARLAEKAVLGAGWASVWANAQHLMLIQERNENNTTDTPNEDGTVRREYNDHVMTTLTLFDLTDGTLSTIATATVEGAPDNAFSLDEWNGHFRLAATYTRYYGAHTLVTDSTGDHVNHTYFESHQERFNRLYVLDGNLNEVGRVDNLAPDEMVQSVRFDGAIGYVVTFRQTDPLFAIDLSDPANPTVLSALKITGFSEYLHPFAENRLFGFGYAGTEDGLNGRLKLTMFDTTDKTDVTVKAVLELPEGRYYSETLSNHHAVLVDVARGVIGLPFATNGGRLYELYRYTEEDGFVAVATTSAVDVPYLRGMFIGNCFYLAHTDGLAVYTEDFAPITTVPPVV